MFSSPPRRATPQTRPRRPRKTKKDDSSFFLVFLSSPAFPLSTRRNKLTPSPFLFDLATKNAGIQRFGYPFMWAGRQITNAIVGADTISYGDAAVIVGAASVSNAGGPWVNGESCVEAKRRTNLGRKRVSKDRTRPRGEEQRGSLASPPHHHSHLPSKKSLSKTFFLNSRLRPPRRHGEGHQDGRERRNGAH